MRVTPSSKRIVYLHQYFKTPQMDGGTRSYEFARRFSAVGYDVHVVTSDTRSTAHAGHRIEIIDGVTVHWIHVAYANKMPFGRRIVAFLSFALRSAGLARRLNGDIVFATSTPLTIIIPALFATLFRKAPLLFEVRDLWPELPIAIGALRNPIAVNAARWLERVAYRTADHIIALSPGMKDGIIAAGVEPSRITVVPNCSDLELFGKEIVPPLDWVASSTGLTGRKQVVYCGALGRINGVSYIVDIAAAMAHIRDDVAFVVVGTGWECDYVRERALTLGVLGTAFILHQPIPKSDVPALLAHADIGMSVFLPVPEMEVNSANKFFDALASGTPIAINYGGWQSDLIEATSCGIVLPQTDAAGAAQRLSDLLSTPEKLAEMALNARHLAETDFSRDALAAKVIAIIDNLTSGIPNDSRPF